MFALPESEYTASSHFSKPLEFNGFAASLERRAICYFFANDRKRNPFSIVLNARTDRSNNAILEFQFCSGFQLFTRVNPGEVAIRVASGLKPRHDYKSG